MGKRGVCSQGHGEARWRRARAADSQLRAPSPSAWEQQDSQRKALEGHMLFPAETHSRVPRTQAPPVSSQPTAAHRLRCPTYAWAPPTKYFKGLQTEGLIPPGAPSALATSRLTTALRGKSHVPLRPGQHFPIRSPRGPAENSAKRSLGGCLSAPQVPQTLSCFAPRNYLGR